MSLSRRDYCSEKYSEVKLWGGACGSYLARRLHWVFFLHEISLLLVFVMLHIEEIQITILYSTGTLLRGEQYYVISLPQMSINIQAHLQLIFYSGMNSPV